MLRPLLPVGLLVVALGVGPAAAARDLDPDQALKAARQGLGRAEADVVAVENAIASARSDVGNLAAQARYFPIEQRVVDADLFFETGDNEKAATLYRDLVENPEFRQRPGWTRVVFQLGESLYRQRNYGRARQYFRDVAGPSGDRYQGPALARLFEVAVHTGDFAAVEDLEGSVAGGAATPEVLYAYGKYLDARRRRPAAQEAFLRVPAGTPPYARAQYFLGVIAVGRKDLDEAFGRFALAASQPLNDDADREVQGASVLAKGRVLCAQGRAPECMQALQEVDRRSAAFPAALFELAWAHYKGGDLSGAARTLDILLMTSPGGDLALQANALRGRILTRLDDPDGAEESYRELSEMLGPVAAELDRLIQEPHSMKACFDFVLDRQENRVGTAPPVTERTMKWLETDRDMSSLMGMFEDLRQQRNDVRESMQMVESLLWALRSGGQLEAFPALKDRYLRLREAEGLAIRAAVGSVRAARPVVRGRLSGDLLARYDRVAQATEDAARETQAVPLTLADYQRREAAVTVELEALGREVFLIDSLLGIQRQQVLAIEQWLQEQRFEKDGPSITPEREAGFKAELGNTLGVLGRFDVEVEDLRERLSRETLTLNTPETLKAEDSRRSAALRAAQAEAVFLKDVAQRLEGADRDVATTAIGLVGRGAAGVSAVGPVVSSLLEVAGRGARDFEAAVLREKARLEASVSEFQRAELDAETLSETEGSRILHVVRKRLGNVLLEADLGLADMAWQREEKVANQLRDLGKEFGAQMKAVDALEKVVKEEEELGAPPPPVPQGQAPVAP